MDFNLIISNPPYGKIGANITKEIIDYVNYDEFINLLPANDYKRNTTADLYNYQSDMESINNGFAGDAAVTTHVARIHKTKVNNMSLDEFERSNYIDRQLDKYFAENSNRPAIQFESIDSGNHPDKWVSGRTLIIGWRDAGAGHMPYSKDTPTYKWNVARTIDGAWIIANCNKKRAREKGKYEVCFYAYTFKTEAEFNNFISFFYSTIGFKFISKVFTALNTDGDVGFIKYLPKVDWTRSWTVEEILADYGYTEDEIKAVMDDLKSFKGMKG